MEIFQDHIFLQRFVDFFSIYGYPCRDEDTSKKTQQKRLFKNDGCWIRRADASPHGFQP
jgi:hypothetical protein